jgi:hypothetical protein
VSAAIGRWLREPLLQFLMAGLALFAAYSAINPGSREIDAGDRIEITADDVTRIRVAWLAQGRGPLSQDQLRRLVDDRVREEILVREALALGLDEDDTIVRRRLAQKMEFLFEDVAALAEPRAGELRAWFEANAKRFEAPARASFRHLYFSPDRRGARARDDAARALAPLAGRRGADAPAADPFPFQHYYGDRSFDEIARDFGPGFARALFALPTGVWSGPIESGYGWHLAWIDSIAPSQVPAFDDVQPDVRREWIEDRRAELRERAFAAMRARYEVVVPELDLADVASVDSLRSIRGEGAR